MTRFALPFVLFAMSASATAAQEDQGPSLMERGALMFLEGILKEMEPAIEEFEGLAEDVAPTLRGLADEMGPKLAEILGQVEDWSAYEAPEILPNGDIIIRRKQDRPLERQARPADPAPQIEL